MLHNVCPNCKGKKIEGFFKINNAPIFSLVTVKSRQEALDVPRKDIELGFCNTCGFIFNRLFDTSIDYFSLGYEDQQGYSQTFMDYLARISIELIDKYTLKGKAIVEIGCGKGDFLNLINEIAGGTGIGIDPSYEDGRQSNPKLQFFKEFYALEHGNIDSKLICCRHTLEHIHQTRDFLQLIRDSIPEGRRPVLFFEIPQINRILDISAFWDIYYEHCSYYSPGSLAYLFRNTGFEILDLRLDYSDQYLLIEAVPIQSSATTMFEIEESVQDQKQRIGRFKRNIGEQLAQWRIELNALKNSGKRTVIWGGGSKAVGFLTNFDELQLIEHVVDINPHMENNFIPGIGSKYVQPRFLTEYKPDAVIIMNGVYKDEITKTMQDMGLFPKVYTL